MCSSPSYSCEIRIQSRRGVFGGGSAAEAQVFREAPPLIEGQPRKVFSIRILNPAAASPAASGRQHLFVVHHM